MSERAVGAQAGYVPARDRILDAAETLFAENGFERTSTARIAAAADVPHGLIFYHFKTKIDLLLAVVREDKVIALDGLVPPSRPGADLREAVAEIWHHLSTAFTEPSPVRRILSQELTAHPEVRQRAVEFQDRVTWTISHHLARASGHDGDPTPLHDAAARILIMAASTIAILGQSGPAVISPEAVAALIGGGLEHAEPTHSV